MKKTPDPSHYIWTGIRIPETCCTDLNRSSTGEDVFDCITCLDYPPIPITGIDSTVKSLWTMAKPIGLIAGPDNPP